MSTGATKSFYCVPRRVGQYVSIRIPGKRKIISICEVQVYSTRRTSKGKLLQFTEQRRAPSHQISFILFYLLVLPRNILHNKDIHKSLKCKAACK